MRKAGIILTIVVIILGLLPYAMADLNEIRQRGVIKHLGVPYANFVTVAGEGLDAEVIRRFAEHIGVKYELVLTTAGDMISNLTGQRVIPKGDDIEILGESEIKGDVIGNGLTVLPWRKKIINYSVPYFPTAIWVVARADSPLRPIAPSGNAEQDIQATKSVLQGSRVLGVPNTCVDPAQYKLGQVTTVYKKGVDINDLTPALIKGEAEITMLDVADALVALEKYPGAVKILGVATDIQSMAYGFSKESPDLLACFNEFLLDLKQKGLLKELILKHYPAIEYYFPGNIQ